MFIHRFSGFRDVGTLAFALMLLLAAAHAQRFNVIHNFTGGADGSSPRAGFTLDAAGNLYGTTYAGGVGYGTVYQLKKEASGWLFNSLYSFTGEKDGAGPFARVNFGPGGVLYGTTRAGGGYTNCNRYDYDGCGTVFSLRPPASACKTVLCPWTETQLYAFMGEPDGAHPAEGDLNFDQAGNIYGATYQGGNYGYGSVFELTGSGNSWSETLLYSFTGGEDGGYAHAVTLQSGNLYGTAITGGADGLGTVFELTPSGPPWIETTLYSFTGGPDGQEPDYGVIFDGSGNMYGSTIHHGEFGGGTAFELSPSGGGWTLSRLYGFNCSGYGPEGAFVMDRAGNLYGTTYADGAYCLGSVFKLTPSGDGTWTYTSLHDFVGGSDGLNPLGNLVLDASGNLYGTTSHGGTGQACSSGCGVIFEITP
jgi:uncharacterized repeat protein (TIGR03803 family)